MKKVFHYLFLTVIIASCLKQNEAPSIPVNETIPTDTTGSNSNTPKNTGNLINGLFYGVTGMVKVYLQNGKYIFALENILFVNGPDLQLYLSKEIQPINYIDLRKLKSTSGNLLYEIPGSPDFMEYTFALVHCQLSNHSFGSALLQLY